MEAEELLAEEGKEQCFSKEKVDAFYASEFEAICFEDATFSYFYFWMKPQVRWMVRLRNSC